MKYFCRSERKDNINDNFEIEEDLDKPNPEDDPRNFVAILVKSLCLLEKLPFAINVSIKFDQKMIKK